MSTVLLRDTGLLHMLPDRGGPGLLQVVEDVHPLVEGLPESFSAGRSTFSARPVNGRSLVTYADSFGGVAIVRSIGSGQAIWIGSALSEADEPMDRLLANAVRSARGAKFLRTDPDTATLAPGGQVRVAVEAQARRLPGGRYRSVLRVHSNDPDDPRVDVPVRFDVRSVYLLGDVNNDRKVNIVDALIVATFDLDPGLTLPDRGNILYGDVDGNGVVDIADALIIATFDVDSIRAGLPEGIGRRQVAPPASGRVARRLAKLFGGAIGTRIFSLGGEVEVEVLRAATGVTSDLWLYAPGFPRWMATNQQAGRGTSLGRFPEGVELVFGISVRNSGQTFRGGRGPEIRTGGPTRGSVSQARVRQRSGLRMGWEAAMAISTMR